MSVIIFTGGGSAGHVIPNLSLIPYFTRQKDDVHYIGTLEGMEAELLKSCPEVTYHAISAGKLRRYFDLQNFIDPFRVLKGCLQAHRLLKTLKPHVVFAKGGFVCVPVVMAAWRLKIPVVLHESDMTPGLANRLCIPFAQRICYTFSETLTLRPHKKAVVTGSPLRKAFTAPSPERGRRFLGFSSHKPVLMLIGGSLGAMKLNEVLRQALPRLLRDFQIVHLCGKGRILSELNRQDYRQYEFLEEEMPHVMAAADMIISRAGAGVLCEIAALKKPSLLIPLSKSASRGDQILNAASFERQGFAKVLCEEQLSKESLCEAVADLYTHRQEYIFALHGSPFQNANQHVIEVIKEVQK